MRTRDILNEISFLTVLSLKLVRSSSVCLHPDEPGTSHAGQMSRCSSWSRLVIRGSL